MMTTTRYRHPGDLLRLICFTVPLIVALAVIGVAADRLLGTSATYVTGVPPRTAAGRLLVGVVQLLVLVAVVAVPITVLRRRRFRLFATLLGAAVSAGLLMWVLDIVVDRSPPSKLSSNLAGEGWLGSVSFPNPPFLAGGVAAAVTLTRWLSPAWRRATWIGLALVAAARLVAGTILPMWLIIAFIVGAAVGTGVLLAFGTPDRRPGPTEVLGALVHAGYPAVHVEVAPRHGKGARGFVVETVDGAGAFVKILGQDQRDADLLYRGYRFMRLRDVGDVRPAASLKQAVEHQALAGMMAERAGVHAPRVHRVLEAPDGSVMLIMELVDGVTLEEVAEKDLTDELVAELWREVDRLHCAHIAHRSLRTANIMFRAGARPWIVDYSFSELSASERAMDLDVAELLASLAVRIGPDRAVACAVATLGTDAVAPAVPLLQPLALSASTRRAVAATDKVLTRTRESAAAATGRAADELAPLQRVRGRTLLMIALGAGAFYFILPQLAQVGDSWRAFQSADWSWLPLVVVMSCLTYVAGAVGMCGTVPYRLPLGPTVTTQFASSFVNRVSPANVGGMALNARFLQKCGADPPTAVAAVGLNSAVGGITHILLIVVFFVWAGSDLGRAFALPSSSKILVVIAVLAALAGLVVLTSWGRRKVLRPLGNAIRSAGTNFARVATSPVKVTMLFGGSAGVTLAYAGALIGAVNAFEGGISVAQIGAVYLGASALAAATPTPGGLGAIEAALVAGLTGVGMASGPAVSAVLTYRLVTYWLPILPGWLSWMWLQRKEYL
jgi:undecaprenyl-diphosphatase